MPAHSTWTASRRCELRTHKRSLQSPWNGQKHVLHVTARGERALHGKQSCSVRPHRASELCRPEEVLTTKTVS